MKGNLDKARKSDCVSALVSLFHLSECYFFQTADQGLIVIYKTSNASCCSIHLVLQTDFSLLRCSPSNIWPTHLSKASCLFEELAKKRQILLAVSMVFLISEIDQQLTMQRLGTCSTMCVDSLWEELCDACCCPFLPWHLPHHKSAHEGLWLEVANQPEAAEYGLQWPPHLHQSHTHWRPRTSLHGSCTGPDKTQKQQAALHWQHLLLRPPWQKSKRHIHFSEWLYELCDHKHV